MAKKLLIVDDSRVSRMIIKSKVDALHLGWEVREAASGDEAMAHSSTWAPDFVTMDVNMPGISGFDAAQQLLALCPQVKVVLLTANIQESSRERAEAMGVKFIHKPVTALAIQQAVDHFLAAA